MMEDIRGAAAFVGAATAGIGEAPGFQAIEILAQAVHGAVADAGLKISDIDGVFGCMQSDFLNTLSVADYLGIHPRFSDNNRLGGSSFLSHALQAAMAIKAGLCSVAVICYGSTQRSEAGRLVATAAGNWSNFESQYGARFPISSYALAASRHMHEYGTTREHLAEVAVAARAWARLNPEAFVRDPLSIADVLASPNVSSPLSRLDCCLVTDGAGALIMVSRERAKSLRKPPVYLLGAGFAHWHKYIASMPNLCVSAATESGPQAFRMAGVTHKDVDLLQVYDAFTINTLMFLEDLGFCPKGEGGRFVSGGRIAPGGSLPVNTNGGGLSYAHPGMYGIFLLIEAVRQLRGEGGERQVANAEICLCQGSGGVLSSQVTNILGTESTL
ncbi:MAG: acetyl-CoA acetyltransferase [Burkholderiaceae bacterium]|nr:acetyl-CoA acetyltransferase [Burkholderiaceae bacterium]